MFKTAAKCFIFLLIPACWLSTADAFGPEEWTQYRMNETNNPVFDDSSLEPLELSSFLTDNEVRATPVVVGERLFVGNHESGELLAFDISTGERVWEAQAPNWVHSEMIFHENVLYVGYGNRFFQEPELRGRGDNGVLALNADSGEVLWEYETPGHVMPTPAYFDGHVYAATGDQHLYKLDADTGEPVHQENIGHVVSMSSPVISDDQLYVGGGAPQPYTFTAYDLADDSIAWQTEFDTVYAGLDDVPPVTADGLVVTSAVSDTMEVPYYEAYREEGIWNAYLGKLQAVFSGNFTTVDTGGPHHVLYGMHTDTGDIVWEASMGKGDMVQNNKSGAPMIYEDRVFIGSPFTESFYAFDLQSGKKEWEFSNAVIKAPPAAKDGIVYFTNAAGAVHALDAESGKELAGKELGGTLAPSGPILINDTLLAGSQDYNVYAVPTAELLDSPPLQEEVVEEPAPHLASEFFLLYIVPLLVAASFILMLLFISKRKKKKYAYE